MTNEERIAVIDKTLNRITERVKNKVTVDGWQYLYARDVRFLRKLIEREGDAGTVGRS